MQLLKTCGLASTACSEGRLLQLFAHLGGGPAPTRPMRSPMGGRALEGLLPIDWSEQAAYMHARGLTLGFAQVRVCKVGVGGWG